MRVTNVSPAAMPESSSRQLNSGGKKAAKNAGPLPASAIPLPGEEGYDFVTTLAEAYNLLYLAGRAGEQRGRLSPRNRNNPEPKLAHPSIGLR